MRYEPTVMTMAGTATVDGTEMAAQLRIEQERIDVSTNLPQPDPDWEFTDAEGHYHSRSADRSHPYPTLLTSTEHRPCDGSCWPDCGGEGYDVTRYECAACREPIEPGTRPGPHYASMPGRDSWEVVVQAPLQHGRTVSVRLASEQGCWFGLAVVGEVTVQASAVGTPSGRSTLYGASPLGVRRRSVVPAV